MADTGDYPRVLFVDDDERILRGLGMWLRKQAAHWEIRYACGGTEALDLIQEWEPDVVVTDMRMPKVDGAELLLQVRECYPEALRIVLTGQADEGLSQRGASLSHYWFDKPCERDRLIEAIELWWGERAADETPNP